MIDKKKTRVLTCECGTTFETSAPNRRRCFNCSPARMPFGHNPENVAQLPVSRPVAPTAPVPVPSSAPAGAIETAVRDELDTLDWLKTVEGMVALALARELDTGDITGAARTSMSKQLTNMMEGIRASAPGEPDELDDAQSKVRFLRGG